MNLRTAKIQLLMLLNDRTPIEQFDVTGPFDFTDELMPLEEFRNIALDARPDLKAAAQNVELAKTTHQLAIANGSTDPTFSVWYSHNPSFANPFADQTIGGSVSIPLRIFDRNQGEKARTQIDIARNERLRDANQAQVFNDVDSAYWTLVQNLNLLQPYKRQISAAGDRCSRQDVVFLPERRRFPAGLSGRGEVLSGHSAGLPESDRFLLDRGRSNESGGRPGGHPMNRSSLWFQLASALVVWSV